MRLDARMMMWVRGLIRLLGRGRLFGLAAFLGVSVFWMFSAVSAVDASAPIVSPSLPVSQSPPADPTATATATSVSAPAPCAGAPIFDEDGDPIVREGDASCPTPEGLGECTQSMYVDALNRDSGNQLHNMVERHTDGGFTVTLILNCRASKITWSVVNNVGRPVPGVSGILDQVKFDEVDWVYIESVEYVRYGSDGPDTDGDGSPDYVAGEIVLDDNGHAVVDNEKMKDKPRYKAYRSRFDYQNAERKVVINGEEENTRPLETDQVYGLRMEIEPYSGAPDNHKVSIVADILDKVSGNLISKLLHLLTPTTWVEWAGRSVLQGVASGVQLSMCTIMPRFMTGEERVAFDHYFDEDDNKWKPVGNQEKQNLPNANGNCKNPPGFDPKNPDDSGDYYDNLKKLRDDVIARKRGGDAYVGSLADDAPLALNVIDRTDPRSVDDAGLADFISYDLGHIPIGPRLILDRNLRQANGDEIASGIVTFTGLITGTPASLTYERGIVRIGWSMILNLTVAIFVLIIVWIGLSQIAKGFLGDKNMADWRELTPRLVLAIIAALTSYWWCSLLIDLADGISRYLAAGMRVTPADVTLVLGQSLASVFVKNLPAKVTNLIPYWGALALLIKLGTMTISVSLMIAFAMLVLMIIGQFVMRIVLLNLLIMLSPLAFAMWALPETASWGKRWLQIFMTTLWQHGLQIICFAMALWFVRLATPIGIVTNTGEGLGGALAGAVSLDLPTEMIWALALGVMGMVVVFKLPGMMGNSVMESWVSTIGMAAMGFSKILGFAGGAMGGGGGSMGGIGMFGAPGGSGGGFNFGGGGGGGAGGIAAGLGGGLPGMLVQRAMGVGMGGLGAVTTLGRVMGNIGSHDASPVPNATHAANVAAARAAAEGGAGPAGDLEPVPEPSESDDKAGTRVVGVNPVSGPPYADAAAADGEGGTEDSNDGNEPPGSVRKVGTSGSPADSGLAYRPNSFNHHGLGGQRSLKDSSITDGEAYAIDHSDIGKTGFSKLASDGAQFSTRDGAVNGRPVKRLMKEAKGKKEPATLAEARIVSKLGIDRANQLLESEEARGGVNAETQAGASRGTGGRGGIGGIVRNLPTAARAVGAAYGAARNDYYDRTGDRLYGNANNQREVVSQNQHGAIAKLAHHADNYGDSSETVESVLKRRAVHQRYGAQSVDSNGNIHQLSEQQVMLRENLSQDDFADNMRYNTSAEKDDSYATGYKVTQWRDGERVTRPANSDEARIMNYAEGTREFNRAFGGQNEFVGDVHVLKDLDTGKERLATQAEGSYSFAMGLDNEDVSPDAKREANEALGKSWVQGPWVPSSQDSGADTRQGSIGAKAEGWVWRGVTKGPGRVASKFGGKHRGKGGPLHNPNSGDD